jgi:hypothetical protein
MENNFISSTFTIFFEVTDDEPTIFFINQNKEECIKSENYKRKDKMKIL